MTETVVSFAVFIRLVVGALEAANIEYLLAGEVAAWVWGLPRAEHSLDLVVRIRPEDAPTLARELKIYGMPVPVKAILDANIGQGQPIALVHHSSGLKASLYALHPGDDLRQSALARRIRVNLEPPAGMVWLISPEDLLLDCLWRYSLDRQPGHLFDAATVLQAQAHILDRDYVNGRVAQKGLVVLWQALQHTVHPFAPGEVEVGSQPGQPLETDSV